MSNRRLVLLFVALLTLYAAGNWALPLIDQDETLFTEASREMLESRDFAVPRSNNQPLFDKPPLLYWLEDAAFKVFGENEFAARLPSGICGALAAVVLALWGTQLYDAATGWRAALMFGLSLHIMLLSHAAVMDMAMIAASTAAAWAGWNWLKAFNEPVDSRLRLFWWWLGFWGFLAVGFLAKWPVAWTPIVMAAWAAAKNERGKRPGALQWTLGAILMLGLVAAWGVPALLQTHGNFAAIGLGKNVAMHSVWIDHGHGAKTVWGYVMTLPFYLITVWLSFFPWSLRLPAVAGDLWARRKDLLPRETYLVTGIVLVFGIFTLGRTKLPHYTLPAFPFMALLTAAWWGKHQSAKAFRWTAGWMVAFGLALCLAAPPLARPFFISRQLYDQAEPWLTRDMELGSVGYDEPSLVWQFRKKIGGFETSLDWKDADDWMHQTGPRVCVMPSDQVAQAFRKLDPAWKVVTAQRSKAWPGKSLELSAVIKM